MIDIHCHILPALDDGAGDSADSIEMARAAVRQENPDDHCDTSS